MYTITSHCPTQCLLAVYVSWAWLIKIYPQSQIFLRWIQVDLDFNQSLSFYSGLSSKNHRQVHWKRSANVQEAQLKIQEISVKWLRKQLGLQLLAECGQRLSRRDYECRAFSTDLILSEFRRSDWSDVWFWTSPLFTCGGASILHQLKVYIAPLGRVLKTFYSPPSG